MSAGGSRSVFVDAGGIRLRALVDGPPAPADVPEFLVLHGFTGSAESMAGVAAGLSDFARVARLELVGHGESEAPDDLECYSMEACAEQIAEAARALRFDRPHLIGYSMGGRAALAAALARPDAFGSLVLVGATAGILDADQRRERIEADRALADSIERDGLERFVDAWMAQPLFASQARLGPEILKQARRQRLANRPRGLANSLRGMGAGRQRPLHGELARHAGPVLLVVGEQDAKFRAIAVELARALPDARIETIAGVGHAAHLEAPARFAQVVRAFVEVEQAVAVPPAPPSIRPASAAAWILAMRPRTLPVSLAPVLVGTAVAHQSGDARIGPALAAAAGALLLQIGSNLANDVFDYEKGADTEARIGPPRATQQGLLSPRAVKCAMGVVFGLAIAIGLYLTAVAGPAIPVIGLLSIVAAIAYTGGPWPLGYHGLGDIAVFVFFGPVAVAGTAFVQLGHVPPLSLAASVPVGALATAILVVNNLRDVDTDRAAGKRTLAVRLGRRGARAEWAALVASAYLLASAIGLVFETTAFVWLAWLSLPRAVSLGRVVFREESGPPLNAALAGTAQLCFLFSLLFAAGLAA